MIVVVKHKRSVANPLGKVSSCPAILTLVCWVVPLQSRSLKCTHSLQRYSTGLCAQLARREGAFKRFLFQTSLPISKYSCYWGIFFDTFRDWHYFIPFVWIMSKPPQVSTKRLQWICNILWVFLYALSWTCDIEHYCTLLASLKTHFKISMSVKKIVEQ